VPGVCWKCEKFRIIERRQDIFSALLHYDNHGIPNQIPAVNIACFCELQGFIRSFHSIRISTPRSRSRIIAFQETGPMNLDHPLKFPTSYHW
jgi:hypothetical protein